MANPPGSDHDADASIGSETTDPVDPVAADDANTDRVAMDPPTEVLGSSDGGAQPERRFTAPGFDAGATQVIPPQDDPATEVFQPQQGSKAVPQAIPPRTGGGLSGRIQNSWGWVLAVTLIVLALAAIAVLGTVLLTRDTTSAASQEEMVRSTISEFDDAMQKGDLTTLRSITCGTTRDTYVNYDDAKWATLHDKVKRAHRYPMVGSIDEVVINGEHAEANVTAYMAYAPTERSTRSFDLQFRDDKWKICQAPMG